MERVIVEDNKDVSTYERDLLVDEVVVLSII